MKVGCTLAMLQCLDRPHRLAYVLGEIFELPAPEAAEALSVEPATFRKRLQRARESIEAFTGAYCGLANEAAACRCPRRVPAAIRLGRIEPGRPLFAERPASFAEAKALIARVEQAKRAVEVHRRTAPPGPTPDIARLVVAARGAASTPS